MLWFGLDYKKTRKLLKRFEAKLDALSCRTRVNIEPFLLPDNSLQLNRANILVTKAT